MIEANEDYRDWIDFFKHRPTAKRIKEIFDARIVGQEHTKRMLAGAIESHYWALWHNHEHRKDKDFVKLSTGAIRLYGPSGCGKTEFFRAIRDELGVPVYITDAASLSKTGYRGKNIGDIIQDYLSLYGKDAWMGIFVFDEVDKVFDMSTMSNSDRAFTNGIIDEFLKLVEGTLYPWPEEVDNDSVSSPLFDTADLQFVFLGSYGRLAAGKRRKTDRVVGF